MTRDESGKYVIRVSMVGVISAWLVTVGFVCWRLMGAPVVISDVAMLFGAIAASMSVAYSVRLNRETFYKVYDLGRESRDAEVRSLRR